MRQTTHILLAAVLAAVLAPEAALAAQGHGRGHANGRGVGNAGQGVVVDRDDQRRIVRDYYRNNALPPGLAKRESLPPGLAKQLRERGELPPGLQKRFNSRFNGFNRFSGFRRSCSEGSLRVTNPLCTQ
jgi:hypothetical protein